MRGLLRIVLDSAPEIAQIAVHIVDGFRHTRLPIGARQQYSARAKKRLDVVADTTKSIPYDRRDAGFPAKIRKRGFKRHG